MLITDFIDTKYYCVKYFESIFYFKFKEYDDTHIYSYNFYLKQEPNSDPVYYDGHHGAFCLKSELDSLDFYLLYDFSIIVNHLPDDSYDKICFKRQCKILSILK